MPTQAPDEEALQRICEEVEPPPIFASERGYGLVKEYAKAVARRYAAMVGAGVPEGKPPLGPWQVSDLDRLWGGLHGSREEAATAAFNLAAAHPGNTALVYEAVAGFKTPSA